MIFEIAEGKKVSKKASEAERYDRKRKMEREAEAQRKKSTKKKSGRPKMTEHSYSRGHLYYDEEYDSY